MEKETSIKEYLEDALNRLMNKKIEVEIYVQKELKLTKLARHFLF